MGAGTLREVWGSAGRSGPKRALPKGKVSRLQRCPGSVAARSPAAQGFSSAPHSPSTAVRGGQRGGKAELSLFFCLDIFFSFPSFLSFSVRFSFPHLLFLSPPLSLFFPSPFVFLSLLSLSFCIFFSFSPFPFVFSFLSLLSFSLYIFFSFSFPFPFSPLPRYSPPLKNHSPTPAELTVRSTPRTRGGPGQSGVVRCAPTTTNRQLSPAAR